MQMNTPTPIIVIATLAALYGIFFVIKSLIDRNVGLTIISVIFVGIMSTAPLSRILPEPAASISVWVGIGSMIVVNCIIVGTLIHMFIYGDAKEPNKE